MARGSLAGGFVVQPPAGGGGCWRRVSSALSVLRPASKPPGGTWVLLWNDATALIVWSSQLPFTSRLSPTFSRPFCIFCTASVPLSLAVSGGLLWKASFRRVSSLRSLDSRHRLSLIKRGSGRGIFSVGGQPPA